MVTYTKCTIAGIVYDDFEDCDIGKSIGDDNSSTRLNIVFPNENGLHKTDFNPGDEVIFYADKDVNPSVTKIFAGTISEIKFSAKESVRQNVSITARDYTSLMQKNTVEPEVYTNKEVSLIVDDLIDKYGFVGITRNNVQVTGTILNRITFKQISLFDALRELAQLSSYFFYVDEDKDVHFQPKGAVSTGKTLDNTNVTKSEFREDVDSIRNRIFVYGDRQLVSHPTETFVADGVGSVFTLNGQPHNTAVTVSGVDQVGDILFQNIIAGSGTNYLVSYLDQQIVFVSGTDLGYSSIPNSGDSVVVNYDISRPIIKLAQDNSSIAKYNQRTQVIVNTEIKDPDQARDIARSQVSLLKDPLIQGRVSIYGISVLNPGETVIVNLADQGQSNQTYEILESTYNFNKKNILSDQVLTVKLSRRIKDVTDVLKDLMLAVKKLEAGDTDPSDVVSRLFLSTGSFGLQVKEWKIKTNYIGNSFILGHSVNGILGSPAVAVNGSQVLLGDYKSGLVIQRSGT